MIFPPPEIALKVSLALGVGLLVGLYDDSRGAGSGGPAYCSRADAGDGTVDRIDCLEGAGQAVGVGCAVSMTSPIEFRGVFTFAMLFLGIQMLGWH